MRCRVSLNPLFGVLLGCAFTVSHAQAATTCVSVAPNGGPSNSHSYYPAISADSRYVAFVSYASNLVPGDANGYDDIFVRDTVAGTTTCVSVNPAGAPGNWYSTNPSISADGRYVAFGSLSSDLVPGDTTSITDIFVRDTKLGVTTRLSVAPNGTPGDRDSHTTAISADGRYVAFDSFATNLVPGDTNDRGDVFVWDRTSGTLSRVSMASDGAPGNDSSVQPSISADGRYVAFLSRATNLFPGDANDNYDVFLRDRTAGTTTLVSRSTAGSTGNNGCFNLSLSADSRYVAFDSPASNLVAGDTNGFTDVFLWERASGAITRISVAPGLSPANDESRHPSISADGRYVAFWSKAANLVTGDTNGVDDIFVRDNAQGTTALVSRASDDPLGIRGGSLTSITGDGRYVAFDSGCASLVPGDANGTLDVFLLGPLLPGPFTAREMGFGLSMHGGLATASAADLSTLNIERPLSRIDLLDALRIARKVAGLEPNP